MNSHLRDAGTPAQRAAEAALQAFTKEREAENAYRHFQNKYQKRKEKGWRNMGPMRAEKHELKEALAAEQARRRRLHETTSPRRRRRALVNEQRQHRDDVVPHRRATPSARLNCSRSSRPSGRARRRRSRNSCASKTARRA